MRKLVYLYNIRKQDFKTRNVTGDKGLFFNDERVKLLRNNKNFKYVCSYQYSF